MPKENRSTAPLYSNVNEIFDKIENFWEFELEYFKMYIDEIVEAKQQEFDNLNKTLSEASDAYFRENSVKLEVGQSIFDLYKDIPEKKTDE